MVRIAVVGAGNWGKNLVRTFASLRTAELAYVCDRSEKVRQQIAALYPHCRVVDDLSLILTDSTVTAVVVAVDAPLHYQFAAAVLQAGKHAYVEKPLTLTADESQKLLDLAARKGVKLMVGHLLEYHPAVAYMKQMIADRRVGSPRYIYSHRLNLGTVRSKEDAWWSLAPHDISVACYLFDAEPVSVSATGFSYLQAGIVDVAFASLNFADGRAAHVHVSWLDPHKTRKITLVDSDKMVVFDDMDATEKIRIFDRGVDLKRDVDSYAEALTIRSGDILIPTLRNDEPLKLECQHFIDSVVNNTQPRSDGHDGLRVVKILEAGTRSMAEGGRPVRLDA